MRFALALSLLGGAAVPEPARPLAAVFADSPPSATPYGILGAVPPWGAMEVDLADGARVVNVRVELPRILVFENIEPRL